MKVQKIKLSSYDYSWIVLDDDYLPIQPVMQFVRFLHDTDKSPCTIRSYAHHLKLFWEYLLAKNIEWSTISLSGLSGFIFWLRRTSESHTVVALSGDVLRKNSTINVILGCLSSFYCFHNKLGNTSVNITEPANLASVRFKPFLHHIHKNKPIKKRVIGVKQVKDLPKTITDDQFTQLLSACTNYRDRFLLYLLHETGLRIGQALALRHEDIVCWDNEIHVRYRTQNLNEVRNKTMKPNIIQVSNTVIEMYSDYVSALPQEKLIEYVFVNLTTYTPLRYSAVKKLFMSLSNKCSIYARPHMLRHSHASSLIQAGWEMSLVQKRLGHSSIQTTVDTYTHIDNKLMKESFKKYLSNKGDK